MSLYLTPEQKAAGQKNFADAVADHQRPDRRQFLKGLLAAGAAATAAAPASYFLYESIKGNPVKAGLIGGGDEGGVLVGNHNPDYLHFIAVSDIRPFNQNRIFNGEGKAPRWGFNHFYGQNARKDIKLYPDYDQLLDDPNIEAVVIALPLHLHAKVAIEAMRKGKHVLCEKLMAWNVSQCKEMIKVAEETNRILTIGHQRHYSLLYAHAVELMEDPDALGTVKHIRALWHRNNAWPKLDKDGKPLTDVHGLVYRDGWHPPIPEEDRQALEAKVRQLGYKNMEELVRWRLFNRTGGGLMAELGSHQLDACSIFLGKVHPLAVQGVGGKFFYRDERESDDAVFVTFEFPGPNYYEKDEKDGKKVVAHDAKGQPVVKDRDDIVVVTYSSLNTNTFEPYGECVMGSHGTLLVTEEKDIMLFPERNPNVKLSDKPTNVTVAAAGAGKAAVESSGSTGALPALVPGTSASAPPVSRGYTEEMEHFAYCVRMHQKAKDNREEQEKWRLTPRCHGKVAMADAIIALTSNQAMRNHGRIAFKPEWFDPKSSDVPDKDMKPTDADGNELKIV
jgi:predicted dehydrogenase